MQPQHGNWQYNLPTPYDTYMEKSPNLAARLAHVSMRTKLAASQPQHCFFPYPIRVASVQLERKKTLVAIPRQPSANHALKIEKACHYTLSVTCQANQAVLNCTTSQPSQAGDVQKANNAEGGGWQLPKPGLVADQTKDTTVQTST